ncbi:MAG: hypothetical protein AAGD12_08440 [Pseudomonadota bacterium]
MQGASEHEIIRAQRVTAKQPQLELGASQAAVSPWINVSPLLLTTLRSSPGLRENAAVPMKTKL